MLIPLLVPPSSRICNSLSNAGHQQQFFRQKRNTCQAKNHITDKSMTNSSSRISAGQAELREKWDFLCQACPFCAGNQSNRVDSSPCLVSVSLEKPQPCPYPAAIRGHAACAERWRAWQGRFGRAASAPRAPQVSCSSPCTTAGQGKCAPSAVETGGGKGYCSGQSKAAHLANCCKKSAVLTGYENNRALVGCGITWKEKTQAKVNYNYLTHTSHTSIVSTSTRNSCPGCRSCVCPCSIHTAFTSSRRWDNLCNPSYQAAPLL